MREPGHSLPICGISHVALELELFIGFEEKIIRSVYTSEIFIGFFINHVVREGPRILGSFDQA